MKNKKILSIAIVICGLFLSNIIFAAEPSTSASSLINSLDNGNISNQQATPTQNNTINAPGNAAEPSSDDKAKTGATSDESINSDSSANITFGGVMPAIGKITSLFGYRTHPIKKTRKLHEGIDLGIKSGSPLYALGDGVVVQSKVAIGYGLVILVKHEAGGKVYYTRYAHLSKKCKVGTRVKRGEIIAGAKSGSSGWSTGPHLHFEVLDENMNYLDPMKFINGSTNASNANSEKSKRIGL